MSMTTRNSARLAILALLPALAAAAAPFEWQSDWRQGLAEASAESRPLFVLIGESGATASLRERLAADPVFVGAASGFVLVRTDWSEPDFAKAFGLEAVAEPVVALIALADGNASAIYHEIPRPEALAKDMKAVVAQMGLAASDQAARDGDVSAAIARLRAILSSQPPYPERAAALEALAALSEGGMARVAEADAAVIRGKFFEAKTAFESIAADYAGTDAERAARERLYEIGRNPRAIEALKAQEREATAKSLMDKANEAASAGRRDEALAIYDQVARDYKELPAAAEAASAGRGLRAELHGEDQAERAKMERECRLWMTIADSFASQGKRARAREYYTKIIDAYPDSEFARLARAKADLL